MKKIYLKLYINTYDNHSFPEQWASKQGIKTAWHARWQGTVKVRGVMLTFKGMGQVKDHMLAAL